MASILKEMDETLRTRGVQTDFMPCEDMFDIDVTEIVTKPNRVVFFSKDNR